MTRRQGHGGQALVEFALIFPIFMLVLLGLFDIGRAVFAYNTITNSAREGARLAIVNQDSASITSRVSAQSPAAVPTTCVVFLRSGRTTNDCIATPVGDKCAAIAVGCVASVEVKTLFQAITPIIGTIMGPVTFTARSEVPIEFVCPNSTISAWSTAGSCPKQP